MSDTDTIPTTRDVLKGMFTENTGRHMLDSGGAYGRNWERNQGSDFDNEPHATISVKWGYIDVTFNTYQWLLERVDYDHETHEAFLAFAALPDNEDDTWLTVMEKFVTHREGAGIYGDGKPMTVNTYNSECLLDQTLQFTYWTENDGNDEFIALQVHGGCDVRGGYTAPKIFRCSIEEQSILDYDRGVIVEILEVDGQDSLFPVRENCNWYSDDGVHWYPDGCCGVGHKQLETYEFVEDSQLDELTASEIEDFVKGKIWTDDDGRPRGPNGGVLKVYFS